MLDLPETSYSKSPSAVCMVGFNGAIFYFPIFIPSYFVISCFFFLSLRPLAGPIAGIKCITSSHIIRIDETASHPLIVTFHDEQGNLVKTVRIIFSRNTCVTFCSVLTTSTCSLYGVFWSKSIVTFTALWKALA